jgi:hypothetical protein
MGRQVRVYMDAADVTEFVAEVVKHRGAGFCKPCIRKDADLRVRRLPAMNTKPPTEVLYFIRPQLTADDLVIEPFDGFGMVSHEDSQIIEFERPVVLEQVCYPGRLWYQAQRTDGSPKPGAFLQWAEALFRWVRKSYCLRRGVGSIVSYCGPHADQDLRPRDFSTTLKRQKYFGYALAAREAKACVARYLK